MSWHEDAACQGIDIDALFGDRYQQQETARKFCSRCPVRFQCAQQGKTEPYGLWGGIPEGSVGRPTAGNTRTPPKPNRGCKVDSCDREHQARGFCQLHYRRLREHGDPKADVPVVVTPEAPTHVGMRVVAQVADEYGVNLSDLLGRKRRFLVARQVAMCRLRDEGWSFPAIGRLFGRHHSTVVHLVQSMEVAA